MTTKADARDADDDAAMAIDIIRLEHIVRGAVESWVLCSQLMRGNARAKFKSASDIPILRSLVESDTHAIRIRYALRKQ